MQPLNTSTTFNGNDTSNLSHTPVLVTCLAMGLCCLVGLPSNIVVIITIAKKLKRRQPNESPNQTFFLKLILSLAVSDSLSLSTIPLAIYLLVDEWSLGSWTCRLFTYALYCCLYGSVLTVTLMGVHRHRAMQNQTRNQMGRTAKIRQLKKRYNKMLVGLWVLVCVLALPTMFTRVVEKKRGKLRCHRSTSSDWGKVSLLLMETFVGFVIPFCILATSYLHFHKRLVGNKSKTGVRNQCIKEEEETVHQKGVPTLPHMTKLVTSILVAFFLFWTPVYIINVVDIITTLTKMSHPGAYKNLKYFRLMFGDAVKALAFINSCLNPFLYGYVYERQNRIKSRG